MKILVACEESQAVTIELRNLGHEAYSCDIQDCSGGHPEWHIKSDVLPLLNGGCEFTTMDTKAHKIVGKWDMILAFPPCTHLAVSGARHFEKKRMDGRQEKAVDFFMKIYTADCDKIAIENPVNIISGSYIKQYFPQLAEKYNLPLKPSQTIQPYYFGEPHRKKTCLWLKNLPKLEPTNTVEVTDIKEYTKKDGTKTTFSDWYNKGGKERQKLRNKTFKGVAVAMATQWARGENIEND
ncbi:MAG: DNA cytosine methyltransferase [Alphaproteobacteria bacterium]|nr:DNA cytosine methyltransferase [Alphaproteobacteria bacterium]